MTGVECPEAGGDAGAPRVGLSRLKLVAREEDGIVLIDQDKCRGWRMCISGCPYKKIYYNWKTGKSEKCVLCYPADIMAGTDVMTGKDKQTSPQAGALKVVHALEDYGKYFNHPGW